MLHARTQASSAISGTAASLEHYSPGEVPARLSPAASPTDSNASSTYFLDLVKSIKNVVVEPLRQPRFLGQSSGITLARLVVAAIRIDTLPGPLFSKQPSYDPSSTALAAGASLPPRHATERLVKVYFQYRTAHLPILTRSEVQDIITSVYTPKSGERSTDRVVEVDMFVAYIVFAIALFDIPNPSGGRPSQSEGCFRSAIG